MAIKFEILDSGILMIRGSGVLSQKAYNEAKKHVVAAIHQQGKINVLIKIEDDFSNLEAFATWDDNQDDALIQQHVNRLAIVGSSQWSEDALLFFLSGLLPFPMHYFKSDQEEQAQFWLLT